jgi:hypothetical protein
MINQNITINPWYLTGLTDGDCTFSFSIVKKNKRKDGTYRYAIQIEYMIVAEKNPANKTKLELIQKYLGVGKLNTIEGQKSTHKGNYRLRVQSVQGCNIIRAHFEKYPLVTTKGVYFKTWCKVLDLLNNDLHLTQEGLNKIVALKEHTPEGLSSKLKAEFPNFVNYIEPRPIHKFNWKKLNIHWIAGFINADGSFKVQVFKAPKTRLGKLCTPLIVITQHTKDIKVLYKIQQFLNLGVVIPKKNQPAADLKIWKHGEINIFIRLFSKTNFYGAKALDYADFCKNFEVLTNGRLTTEKLAEIEARNSNVNSKRTQF